MQQLSFPEIFLHILLTDFLRYFLAAEAAYLVFWIIFFKKWRHRVIQQKPLESDKIGFEFRYSMSTVFIFALVGFGIFSLKKAGYTRTITAFILPGGTDVSAPNKRVTDRLLMR